jgi:hypothetical protein
MLDADWFIPVTMYHKQSEVFALLFGIQCTMYNQPITFLVYTPILYTIILFLNDIMVLIYSGGFGTSTATGIFGQSGQTNMFGPKTTSGGLFGNSSTTFSAPSAFTNTFGNKPVR